MKINIIENLLSKGWKQIGKFEKLPLLQHPSGTEVVLDKTGKLIPKQSFSKHLEIEKEIKEIKKRNAPKKTNIPKSISQDARKRNLGLLDFSKDNWFSYARNYKTPKEDIEYYEQKFLPQIEEAYNRLVRDKKLYFSPKTKKVIGIIDEKPVVLDNTEDKMAYIVTNTPNASHLQFDGTVYATGVPGKYVRSFLANGGASKAAKPTWGSSYLGSQAYYAGSDGISGIFTSVKPKLIPEYFETGTKSNIPDKPIMLNPTAINPTSHRFVGNNPINAVISREPFAYQITTRPIRDDAASSGLNHDVITKMQVIGPELKLKAILGNSGRYSKTDNNPFNMFIPPLLMTGGLGGLAYAANERSN